MTDIVSKDRRSEIMASVGHKDTGPEKVVRSYLYGRGLRYRLHAKGLPGKPDMVFARRKVVLFINGCFWHGHLDIGCKLARTPKSNVVFWEEKIRRNRERDERNWREIESLGWRVMVIWECELRQPDVLKDIADQLVLR